LFTGDFAAYAPAAIRRRDRRSFRARIATGKMHNRWDIEKWHLTINAPDGDKLSVVSYAGGDCGITRNGEPVQEFRWDGSRMADCTAAILRLAGRCGGGAE